MAQKTKKKTLNERAQKIEGILSGRMPWLNKMLGNHKNEFYMGIAILLEDHKNIGYTKIAEVLEENEEEMRAAIRELVELRDNADFDGLNKHERNDLARLRPPKEKRGKWRRVEEDQIATIVLSSVVVGYTFNIDPRTLLLIAGKESKFGSCLTGPTGDLGVWMITEQSALKMKKNSYEIERTNRAIEERIPEDPRTIIRISSAHYKMKYNIFTCCMVAGQTLMGKLGVIKTKEGKGKFSDGLELKNEKGIRVVGKYYNGKYGYGEDLWRYSKLLFQEISFTYGDNEGSSLAEVIPKKR